MKKISSILLKMNFLSRVKQNIALKGDKLNKNKAQNSLNYINKFKIKKKSCELLHT